MVRRDAALPVYQTIKSDPSRATGSICSLAHASLESLKSSCYETVGRIGQNLRIEPTDLPANRISVYDLRRTSPPCRRTSDPCKVNGA